MPMIIKNKSNLDECSVTRSGIGMTNGVVEKAKWKISDNIQVGFIENAACLILRNSDDKNGFKLSYSNKTKKSGGKVYCMAFIQNYLQTIFEIPKKGISPVHLSTIGWEVALILDEPEWLVMDFTKSDVNKIQKDHIGVYELLGKGDIVLRIGEGKIYDRLNAHLKDKRFAPPTIKSFRYVVLNESIDGQLFEKILIKQFEDTSGVLPRFQEIRA